MLAQTVMINLNLKINKIPVMKCVISRWDQMRYDCFVQQV